MSRDGEAIVHHDDVLGRLTQGTASLADLSTAQLKATAFKATADRMLTLGELCDLVDGRVTLLVEIKSHFNGDLRLARRTAAVLETYRGPVAAMSFDPDVVAALRTLAPKLTRGIVAERHYTHAEWAPLPAARKWAMTWLTHAPKSRPQFLAYHVKDLPAVPALIARNVFGLPLLTWTVRSEDDRQRAARFADQMIFEGWRP